MWNQFLALMTTVMLGQVNPGPVAEPGPSSGGNASAGGELRLARSQDGVHFEEAGVVLARSASAPDLERLPNGDLLLLFEQTVERKGSRRTLIVASRSSDDGRTWSALRPIRLFAPDGRRMTGHHPDLVHWGRRQFRLFFTSTESKRGHASDSRADPWVTVHAAVTRNGLDYLSVATIGQPLPAHRAVHLAATWWRDAVHLYVSAAPSSGKTGRKSALAVTHFVSKDGHSFKSAPPPVISQNVTFGKMESTPERVRLYGVTEQGIVSLVSRDGRRFERSPEIHLKGGTGPAAVRLEDGSILLAYCVPMPGGSGSGPDTDEAGVAEFRDGANSQAIEGLSTSDLALLDEAVDVEGLLSDPGTDGLDWLGEDQLVEADVTVGPDYGTSGASDWIDWQDADQLSLPPLADFDEPVDYLEWYEQAASNEAPDNAFDAYTEFMPMPWDDTQSEEDWPDLKNMFSDKSYDGPPQPWNPKEHPEWEASNSQAQDLLEAFREAGWHEQYSVPPIFGDERLVETPDGEPFLLEMQLPHLAPHRQLARATMADAWRMDEDGKVSPGRMLDAFETTLRNAKHLANGTTLIENLVGTAESRLVHRNALSALKQGVFDERELEEALDILIEHDRDDSDPVRLLRGEHAVAMQATQRLFSPQYSDQAKRRTAEMLVETTAASGDRTEQIAEMTLEEGREAVDAFDGYYLEMANNFRVGYPQVRIADMDAAVERYLHTNALTETLMPSLSRVHALRTRAEASRRATQLAYATHLFKARNGHWPGSLDELPERLGKQMRTDPFTGRDFVYRVDEQGPTIYSASENGLDDGGVHSPNWSDEVNDQAGSDDYVFWPPQE